MLSVCIADDENDILQGLIRRIEKSGLDLYVAGTAKDGLEAMTLFEQMRPDIFLVDVNMPLCDGLQFIEQVRQLYPSAATRFMIVSGYDDFSYMQRAIRTGVANYLMKPINQTELEEALAQLTADIGRSQTTFAKNYYGDSPAEVESANGTMLLCYKKKLEAAFGELIRQQPNLPQTLFPHEIWNRLWFRGQKNVCLMVAPNRVLTKPQIHSIYQHLNTHLSCIMIWAVQISSIETGISELEYTLTSRLWDRIGCRQSTYSEEAKAALAETNFEAIILAVGNNQVSQYRQGIEKLFQQLFHGSAQHAPLAQCHRKFVLALANLYMSYSIPIPDQLKRELYPMSLCQHETRQSILEKWLYMADKACLQVREAAAGNDLISKVTRYLSEHYREDLSLSELAAEFYLAPNYLARKFKEKKQMTVMQYIEELRIGQAKELLINTNLKITDIAGAVGYHDPNYFTRIFRKSCHVSPKFYRDNHGK